MKVPVVYLTLWSACQAAAYISRMSASGNRLRAPAQGSAFRPGVSLAPRPWTQRLVQSPSNRSPYVVYRNGPPPQRYSMKHFGPTRMFPSTSWKSTRLSSNPEMDFVRAASQTSSLHANGDSGAIHTIPAPNLSLSEKPIVVIDADAMTTANGVMSDARKPTYEVTEKYVEQSVNRPGSYREIPAGFPETTALMRHNAALQLASELGLQAVALHQHSLPQQSIQPHPFLQQFQQQQLQQHFQQQQFQQQHEQLQQQSQLQQPLIPQQFSLQGGFTAQPSQQDLLQAGTEGIVIPPSALYQQDPNFLQKLQNQLLQRFPSVEFIPYNTPSQMVPLPVQQNAQPELQLQQNEQPQASQNEEVVYINKDPIAKQTASGFVPNDAKKNVVQRETQESTLVTLVPQGFVATNITEAPIEISTAPKAQPPAQPPVQIHPQTRPQNVTVLILPADSQPITTTIKYIIDTTTEAEKATPVYYPPTEENLVHTAPSAFITEAQDISDIKVLPEVTKASEKAQENNIKYKGQVENAMTTTIDPDMHNYFSIQNSTNNNNNETVTELKPILGIPFAKKADSASVAYTFVRTDEKEPKMTQNGERIYMGQLVEAKITEDHEYNKEKATSQSRAPLRLFVPQSSTQSNTVPPSTVAPQKAPAIKARIPPRSKLTFDDRTGEPVLRIYASYVDNPTQKEAQSTKEPNIRSRNEISSSKDNSANWKSATVKKMDKPRSRDPNRVTSFGLKLRSRSDDYIPLFDEYEE